MKTKIQKLTDTLIKQKQKREINRDKLELYKVSFYRKLNNYILKNLFTSLSKDFIIENNNTTYYVLLSVNPRIVVLTLHMKVENNFFDNPSNYINDFRVQLHDVYLETNEDLQKVLSLQNFFKKIINNKNKFLDFINKSYYNHYLKLQKFKKELDYNIQKSYLVLDDLKFEQFKIVNQWFLSRKSLLLSKDLGEKYWLVYGSNSINNIIEIKLLEVLNNDECVIEILSQSSNETPISYKLKASSFKNFYYKNLDNIIPYLSLKTNLAT
jgi:hypothetical protein